MPALLRRLFMVLATLLIASFGTFYLVELVPGDPALRVVGENASTADYQRVRQEMGLDEPVLNRYGTWLSKAVRGDLGRNLVAPTTEVSSRIAAAFPVNLELAVLALAMALVVSIPLALWSAFRADGLFDRITSATMFGLISVPAFLGGVILILLFAVTWKIFPLGQWARPTEHGWARNLSHAFLPALTLALTEIAVFTRLLRADMIATLKEDYVRAARAKGMPTWHILLREALRPSSFSLITLAGVSIGRLIGGTVIVEQLFSLPGLGQAVVGGARANDFTLVQGGVLVIAVTYILCNLVVDLLYTYLDPRVRLGRS